MQFSERHHQKCEAILIAGYKHEWVKYCAAKKKYHIAQKNLLKRHVAQRIFWILMKNRKENFFINDLFRDDDTDSDNDHYNRDDVDDDDDDDDEDDIMNQCLRFFPHITMQSRIITTCSTVVV